MGGNKVSPNPWLVEPLGQWIQLNFRHRKILSIVSRQHATVLDRRGSHDRVDERQRSSFLSPNIFQLSTQSGSWPSDLKTFQTLKKCFRLNFFSGTHPGIKFRDIQGRSREHVSRADSLTKKLAASL